MFNLKLKSVAFLVSVLCLCLVGAYAVLAWTEPSGNPPDGNVSPPINESDTAQTKQGALIINDDFTATGVIRADGSIQVDGREAISDSTYSHTARSTISNHYGYFEVRRGDNQRGAYFGYGVPGSYVDLYLENGNDLSIRGGNVGIGMTDPGAKLDVSGNIRLSGNLFGDISSQRNLISNNVYNSGISGYKYTNGKSLASGNNRLIFSRESSYTTNYAKVLTDGYYSLSFWYKVENYVSGTSIRLDINDQGFTLFDVSSNKGWTYYSDTRYISVNSYGFLDFSGTFNADIIISDIVVVRSPKPSQHYMPTPEDLVQYNNAGNVGIGTTAPSGSLRLDVEGLVGATGYCDNTGANCYTTSELLEGAGAQTLDTSGINITLTGGGSVIAPYALDAEKLDNVDGASYLRSDANDTYTGVLTINGDLQRAGHSKGYFVGSYNNIGANSAKSNPIYVIGSNYKPTDTLLSNMYGIGYSNDNFWYDILGVGRPDAGWGMYVAADGDIRATISGTNGDIWIAGEIYSAGTETNYFAGKVGIGTTAPSGSLRLDVEGLVGATGYCDNAGANCKTILELAGGGDDDLGDHTATENIRLNNFWLSNDGGNEGIRVSDTGNVGIGTTAPDQPLTISGSLGGFGIHIDSTNGAGIEIDRAGVSNTGGVYWQTAGSDGWFMGLRTDTDGRLHIKEGNQNGIARLTILPASGNVGIGRTSPSYPLDVQGNIRAVSGWFRSTGNYGLYNETDGTRIFSDDPNYWEFRSNRGIRIDNISNVTKGYLYHNNLNGFGLRDADNNWVFRSERDSYNAFYVNNSEKMRMTSAGNVGIGTTIPNEQLHIESTDAAIEVRSTDGDAYLILNRSETAKGSQIFFDTVGSRNWSLGTADEDDVAGATGDEFYIGLDKKTPKFWIETSGKVGIGTTNPSGSLKLDVEGLVGATGYCDNTGANCKTILELAGGGGDDLGDHTATENIRLDDFWLSNDGGNEGIRVDNVGNVGIGITNPIQKLEVAGNIVIKAGGYIDDDSNTRGVSDDWIRLAGFIEMRSNTDGYGIVLRDKDADDYFNITQVDNSSYLTNSNVYSTYFLKGDYKDATIGRDLTITRNLRVNGGISTYDLTVPDNTVETEQLCLGNGVGCIRQWSDVSPYVTGDNLGDHTATQNINVNKYQMQNMRLQNIASQAAENALNPAVGQIWIRTDL